VSLSLQGMRYVESKVLKRMVTLIKAAEREKKHRFRPWFGMLGAFNKMVPQELIRAAEELMFLISMYGPRGIVGLLGREEKVKELEALLTVFEREYPHRAEYVKSLLDDLALIFHHIDAYFLPPDVIDFEEPEEGSVALPFSEGEEVDLTPPEGGGEE